jgi:hypothetical protein
VRLAATVYQTDREAAFSDGVLSNPLKIHQESQIYPYSLGICEDLKGLYWSRKETLDWLESEVRGHG